MNVFVRDILCRHYVLTWERHETPRVDISQLLEVFY